MDPKRVYEAWYPCEEGPGKSRLLDEGCVLVCLCDYVGTHDSGCEDRFAKQPM